MENDRIIKNHLTEAGAKVDDQNNSGIVVQSCSLSGHISDSARSASLTLKKEQRQTPCRIVLTERKISYQTLMDPDIQIKAKRNPFLKGFIEDKG